MPTNSTSGAPNRGYVYTDSVITATGTGVTSNSTGNGVGRAANMMEEVLRQARESAVRRNTPPTIGIGLGFDSDNDIFGEVENTPMPMPLDCSLLKKRHLTKNERQVYHNPKRDWELTSKGEMCKSTCSLYVDDLVE